VSGAGNQQERLSIEAIPSELGSFLAGFALGEASFMIVCRKARDRKQSWRISAAFNVSQHDRAPLDVFSATLGCGTMRRAGNGGWYWEVNRLSDIQDRIVPFFERFPLIGSKQEDFTRFASAVEILARGRPTPSGYAKVLALREGMNRGGKRRHTMERILRDYTPNSPAEQPVG
jgi:LAGLIDADG endonuclease